LLLHSFRQEREGNDWQRDWDRHWGEEGKKEIRLKGRKEGMGSRRIQRSKSSDEMK